MKIHKVTYESDIYYVYCFLLRRGYSVTLKDAETLWEQFSDCEFCANCMNPTPELLDEFVRWIIENHEVTVGE